MSSKGKKVLIVNSINDIPSNQQYFLLGLELHQMGYEVIHIKDNPREIKEYPGKILYWKNKGTVASLLFFYRVLIRYKKFDLVILNFRSRKYSFIFYPFSKKTIVSVRSDFFPDSYFHKIKTSLNYIFCTHILTLSEFVKQKISDRSFTKNKIVVLHNSIKVKEISGVCKSYRKPPFSDVVKVIFVGNLEIHKGFDLLIDYFVNNSSPKMHLTIIGEGSLMESIPEESGRITFLGRKTHNETLKEIKKSHFLILPSRNEAFGQVVIEAMTLETIPLVIRGTGSQELIEDRKTGFIGSSVEECIEFINTLTKQEFNELQRNLVTAVEKFDTGRWIENFKRIFIQK